MKRDINCECNSAHFVFALSLMAELEWVEVAENTFEDGRRARLACIVCVYKCYLVYVIAHCSLLSLLLVVNNLELIPVY